MESLRLNDQRRAQFTQYISIHTRKINSSIACMIVKSFSFNQRRLTSELLTQNRIVLQGAFILSNFMQKRMITYYWIYFSILYNKGLLEVACE